MLAGCSRGHFPSSGERSRPSHRPGYLAGLIASSFFLTRGLCNPVTKGSSGAALPSGKATGLINPSPVYPEQQNSILTSPFFKILK